MRGWPFLAALGLLLFAGCGSDKGSSSKTLTGPTTFNLAKCSAVFILNGTPTTVSGDRSTTQTVGNTSITFGPDCAETVTTTTTTPAPA